MELTDLRYFVNAATSGSFVAAARRSHVSPPAMTKAIRKLEEQLAHLQAGRAAAAAPGAAGVRGSGIPHPPQFAS